MYINQYQCYSSFLSRLVFTLANPKLLASCCLKLQKGYRYRLFMSSVFGARIRSETFLKVRPEPGPTLSGGALNL